MTRKTKIKLFSSAVSVLLVIAWGALFIRLMQKNAQGVGVIGFLSVMAFTIFLLQRWLPQPSSKRSANTPIAGHYQYDDK